MLFLCYCELDSPAGSRVQEQKVCCAMKYPIIRCIKQVIGVRINLFMSMFNLFKQEKDIQKMITCSPILNVHNFNIYPFSDSIYLFQNVPKMR